MKSTASEPGLRARKLTLYLINVAEINALNKINANFNALALISYNKVPKTSVRLGYIFKRIHAVYSSKRCTLRSRKHQLYRDINKSRFLR